MFERRIFGLGSVRCCPMPVAGPTVWWSSAFIIWWRFSLGKAELFLTHAARCPQVRAAQACWRYIIYYLIKVWLLCNDTNYLLCLIINLYLNSLNPILINYILIFKKLLKLPFHFLQKFIFTQYKQTLLSRPLCEFSNCFFANILRLLQDSRPIRRRNIIYSGAKCHFFIIFM